MKLKNLSFLIELLVVISLFYAISPVIDMKFYHKFISSGKGLSSASFEMMYPTSRRNDDKVLLYIALSILSVCYFTFKLSFYWVENALNKDKAFLRKILSIRIGLFILIFLSAWVSIIPFTDSVSDATLGSILIATFLPLILGMKSLILMEIHPDKEYLIETIKEALIIFVTFPICGWLAYYIGIKFFPSIFNKYTAIFLLTPVLTYFLMQFKSVRNLNNDFKQIDDFFKNRNN